MTFVELHDAPAKTPFKGIATRLSRLPAALGEGLVDVLETGARLREVSRLRAMSDAELALHHITREEIVPHVFRDRYCY
ncbi:hypothetical protein C8J30_101231 [Rhodobacter viridis]|uniref:Uncharacterized protein n=1 Tax=Rhodobacter viridis TaxID=1054202 RepID=A0A318U304_9RHOB|nr:DUF1127 domain-containing protein [Rhodobacter viridis]PYF12850.1 hypothetical protein C8J30_101231 [Rhodobacter viridis]